MIILKIHVYDLDWGGETQSPLTHKSLPSETTATIKFSQSNAPKDYWDYLTAVDDYCYDVFGAEAEEFKFKLIEQVEQNDK
tara:strand:- start:1867 stop:2109 length:243 start_codon:yes stop_codon:yes gene_type:complete